MVHRIIIYRPLGYGDRPMPAIADDESQRNFILAFVLGLIALVILFVIGIALYSHSQKARTATATGLAAKVSLRKPAMTTGSGSDAQARRVEVKVVD